MFIFVGFNERCQHFQAVTFRGIGGSVKKALYLLKCSPMVCLCSDRFYLHCNSSSQIVVASILSYSRWVPMKRM